MATQWKVLISGASGFLGQHIIREMQKNPLNGLTKIVALDKMPFQPVLAMPNTVPVESICGDVTTDKAVVENALSDVDSVIHCAGLVSTGAAKDHAMSTFWNVNVNGTRNVLTASLGRKVKSFLYTSTADVVIGTNDIIFGNERNTPVPKKHLFPGYPSSKLEAERLIHVAASKQKDFRTAVIRPTVMFGEGDPYFIPSALAQADKTGGSLARVGGGGCLQLSYVGNVAWAHVKLLELLRSQTNGAEPVHSVFYATDDTPFMNVFDLLEFFLLKQGSTVSRWSVPYHLAEFGSRVAGIIRKIPGQREFASDIPPLYTVRYTGKQRISFSDAKLRRKSGYQPIYSWEEAFTNTNNYFIKNLANKKK